jgi:shikimate kinase
MKDIILTGPKHSGKTSAGRALVLLCDKSCEFIDLDDLILQRTGKSPRQLYSEAPAVFQKAEADAIAALFSLENTKSGFGKRIISTGGGIIDNPEAIEILKNCGAAKIFLNVSADTAWERISGSPGGELPPFLRTDNPRNTHLVMHEKRAASYTLLADIVIKAEGKTPEEIAAEIYRASVTF